MQQQFLGAAADATDIDGSRIFQLRIPRLLFIFFGGRNGVGHQTTVSSCGGGRLHEGSRTGGRPYHQGYPWLLVGSGDPSRLPGTLPRRSPSPGSPGRQHPIRKSILRVGENLGGAPPLPSSRLGRLTGVPEQSREGRQSVNAYGYDSSLRMLVIPVISVNSDIDIV